MANRYVRVYAKPASETGEAATILGFSMSASGVNIEYPDKWDEFFWENELEVREMDFDNDIDDQKVVEALGGVSCQYFEVRPPMSEEQLRSFGGLCAQYVDPSNDEGYLVDNRDSNPAQPFDYRGKILARW